MSGDGIPIFVDPDMTPRLCARVIEAVERTDEISGQFSTLYEF
jgi:hypothetical protein